MSIDLKGASRNIPLNSAYKPPVKISLKVNSNWSKWNSDAKIPKKIQLNKPDSSVRSESKHGISLPKINRHGVHNTSVDTLKPTKLNFDKPKMSNVTVDDNPYDTPIDILDPTLAD